jgi:hypothetical protein
LTEAQASRLGALIFADGSSRRNWFMVAIIQCNALRNARWMAAPNKYVRILLKFNECEKSLRDGRK